MNYTASAQTLEHTIDSYQTRSEAREIVPREGFFFGQDAKDYIKAVKTELIEKGIEHSSSELYGMCEGIKDAYHSMPKLRKQSDESLAKKSEFEQAQYKRAKRKRDEMLSDYRSCLLRIRWLNNDSELAEGKTLDQVMYDGSSTLNQRFRTAKKWIAEQSATDLHKRYIDSVNATKETAHSLVREKNIEGKRLTKGELRAYDSLVGDIKRIRKDYERELKLEPVPETLDFSPNPPEKKPEITYKIKPKSTRQGFFRRAANFFARHAILLYMISFVGCATAAYPIFTSQRLMVSVTRPAEISYSTLERKVVRKIPAKKSAKKEYKANIPSPRPELKPSLAEAKPIKAPEPTKEEIIARGYHVIKPGETLITVARDYKNDKEFDYFLRKLNNIKDPRMIQVGTIIKLREGVDLEEIASKQGITLAMNTVPDSSFRIN
ncbi:LysM peptidoglycan-binding domain-containing protein [Candidatus Woesearchaeota archaeon]|jgi:LysM repeat protein|nr:LysM peptidoglycan-binding domain-containing protein [Candidatus Woesearchaeota archaeon]MBT5272813.1 LysM peptidoglycan-binding domain-containing protein [Candidatus Woesearchaeota archaeon]MBT6040425.1 LysM peptidoglycan-binding domain-containing protein [Candidatus Woesearchaeota archaeon]MBT6336942.1 LysM peptidoglycan-binding domain-containing protein [Candidatus Woesearchaeota archaeon]MBT7926828.1 LysM peptidoglycan-binding domain-containing protein [Candidatus Woesearchaeota archaeon